MRRTLAVAAVAMLVALSTACTGSPPTPARSPDSPPSRSDVAHPALAAIVEDAMRDLQLRAVIVEVRDGDDVVLREAFGESMTGVPASTDMHFRNGAVAFAYISNLVLQYVDEGRLSLDDTIDAWVPELPESDRVTVLMLMNQTTGYPDFEQNADWLAAYNADPFHLFTYEERIDYAFSTPLQFEPGSNWSYAHTNFMILGRVLEVLDGRPLDEQIAKRVLEPMGLSETAAFTTSFIPEPVLHAFSSERRAALGVPDRVAFSEESTFWNPAWGTPIGLAQTTTVSDLATSAIAFGTGELLSDDSFHAMTDPNLLGFGERQPGCAPSCFTQVEGYNYGLGIVRSGQWMLQNPLLSGYSATAAYLPSRELTIAVANTFAPGAFDCNGVYDNAADRLFRLLATELAPDAAPPTLPPRVPDC